MGFRFRRSLKIAPGIHLNLSKSGPSVSLGPRGAKYTIGPRGDRATVGIPCTGLSYTATGHHTKPSREEVDSDDFSTSSEVDPPTPQSSGKGDQFLAFCSGFFALALAVVLIGGFLLVAFAFIHWILKP